jgi:hypothetical protein
LIRGLKKSEEAARSLAGYRSYGAGTAPECGCGGADT